MHSVNKDRIFWKRFKNEIVILNIDTDYYYTLDEVGSIIWNAIADNRTVEEAVASITAEFDIDKETVAKDANGLIKRLEDEMLVKNV